MELWPGKPFPLGASISSKGANFAVASDVAESVLLCLFDDRGAEERVALQEQDGGVWHGFVPGIVAGQLYGYRVVGPFAPAQGQRCNPNKLLLDPYARAIDGDIGWGDEVMGYPPGDPDGYSELDSAACTPRGVVLNDEFDWGGDRRLAIPYSDTIVYETHVKGFSQQHPGVPKGLRGTYAGLATPAGLKHLQSLGVNCVELLPIHHHVDDAFLRGKGLQNYWGYSTLGYFAPHAAYSAEVRAGRTGGQVAEFKGMVKALHAAGIEVILDVVFNHTAEGNHLGPTLSLRGLDNAAYYRLVAEDSRYYFDTSGAGNSLNVDSPVCLRLVMDSLRYWVEEMHVDGFRFDLAVTLAREHGAFDKVSAFFDLVSQDPVISQVKLIAEPWDVGQSDSYDLGRFPDMWSEWNGKYRDCVRDFWRGQAGTLPELATRLTGSADLYGSSHRRPNASINFVTCHDGFTLADLVSYEQKRNESNGESNRDGNDDNRSWNCGVEGPTRDVGVNELRARQSRAMLATLMLSLGVPMLLGGDEMGRTQQGNNNAYCQDNEISWFDWSSAEAELLAFTSQLIGLRKRHHVLRRRRFVTGATRADIRWFMPAGFAMTDPDWAAGWTHSVAAYLDGVRDADRDDRGRPLLDDDVMLLINGWSEALPFTLPDVGSPRMWEPEMDTFSGMFGLAAGSGGAAGATVTVGPRSLVVLRAGRTKD